MNKNITSPIHIAFITDDNYVIPTCVAISSIIETKEPATLLCIHIVCASLSSENQDLFYSFLSDTVEIDIIIQDADRFLMLHQVVECSASRAALLKFVLPELLPNCKRVLYLDGDILVKSDLTELFNVDLADNYVAAVLDGFKFINTHFPSEDTFGYFFNSGVMILNLQLMREDNITNQLIEAKAKLQQYRLMDQIAFNYVIDKRVSLLPVRYNLQLLSSRKVSGDEMVQLLNKNYGTQYDNFSDLMADAVVVHFASTPKPWNAPTTLLFEEWYLTYLQSPVMGRLPPLSQMFALELGKIRNSWSYRIGCAITLLPRMICKGIRCIKNRGIRGAWNRLFVHLHLKKEKTGK